MKSDFKFKTKPYKHQLEVFQKTRDHEAWALFLDLGTGKSKVTLDTASWLFSQGQINGLLVIAPKGVYGQWAVDQIPTHVPDYILDNAVVVKWKGLGSKKNRDELDQLYAVDPMSLHILVMNIEAINSKAGLETAVKFLRGHETLMVVDESTTIKNPQASWTKRIVKLGKGAKYRRILTGTPVTNSPLDVYSQFDFLKPGILGHSSYYSFRNRYALLQRRRVNTHSFDEVVGYQNLHELHEVVCEHACIIRKEDCLDLPAKTYVKREVELSDKQRKIYDQLRKLSIAQLEGAGLVTADMALTKLLRLHQITCGFVGVDDYEEDSNDALGGSNTSLKRIEEIDPNGGPRLQELLRVIEETSGKIIIWANYVHNLRMITNALKKEYGSRSTALYAGETPQEEREGIVKSFQDNSSDLRFFVGQPRTGGYGLTLTAANTVIYFSNNFSLETRLQSEDRAHRIGQNFPVTYIDLVAPDTVDQKIITALHNKQDLAEQVINGKWKDLLA